MILIFGCLVMCLFTVHASGAVPVTNEGDCTNLTNDVSSAINKLTSTIQINHTVGFKQFQYLQKHPQNLDVTFLVGPKKCVIKAPKIFLALASPVFERELEGRMENNLRLVESINEILLPDFDPQTFKLFVELTILDGWSMEALTALELPSNQQMLLMYICEKYKMTTGLKNLKELTKDFIRNFSTLEQPDGFLLLSKPELEAILSSDELLMNETDIYHYAYSWAEEKCAEQNLEVTGENIRKVLGTCLYQIRFPLMSIPEFVNVTRLNGLLSCEETLSIFQLLGTEQSDRRTNDTTVLKFKVKKRAGNPFTSVPRGSSRISVAQVYPVEDTPFVCNGSFNSNAFNTNATITLRGFGFLGPIAADAFYTVAVQIWKNTNGSVAAYSNRMEKRIFAQKSKTFYFVFDLPIVLNPIPHDGWENNYQFSFLLTGPNTRSLSSTRVTRRIYDDKEEFVILWLNSQLVEILYDPL